MGEQRERDAAFFYTVPELREMTGYTPKRLNEIISRYTKRVDANGRKRRSLYLAEKQIANDKFSRWLLYERYRAPRTQERPYGAITWKRAGSLNGFSYNSVRQLIRTGQLDACVYRGLYYVDRVKLEELRASRCAEAPNHWVSVVAITVLAGRTRQAVWDWINRRRLETRMFIHPKRAQLAQHLPVRDALDYLTCALGSAHAAIRKLKDCASRYFRALSKRSVELFDEIPHEPKTTLDITFIARTQLLPLNSPPIGHDLLGLRT